MPIDTTVTDPILAIESMPIVDSGERRTFATGAQRDRGTLKGAFHLRPYLPQKRVAIHYEKGAAKYSPDNWRKGMPTSNYADSASRHLAAYIDGDRSEDHLAAVIWNCEAWIQTEAWAADGTLPAALDDMNARRQQIAIDQSAAFEKS